MSNVSNRHAVVPFVAGTSKPLSDQRLCKAGFKLTEKMKKEGKKALPSVCASVPALDTGAVSVMVAELMPHIVAMLEKAQDEILRAKYEAAGGVCTEITDEELSIPQCIAYLNAEGAGSRLSVESIGLWFDTALNDAVTLLVADKLGFDLSTPEQDEVVAKHVKSRRDIMAMLAGKNVILGERQQISAIKSDACELAPEDTMFGKLNAKFTALTARSEEDWV
jgi:hypothetical protein